MNNGIMLPLLLLSILYGITILLAPACISNSAVNDDQFLFKCTESILTVSISPSLYPCGTSSSSSFHAQSLLLWHTFLKCLVLPQTAHIFPYTGYCLSTFTPPQYQHGHHCDVRSSGPLVLPSFGFFTIFTLSNCLDSVIVFKTAVWVLCASTLFAQASMPPLVMWSSSLAVVNSFIISSSMYLSFKPLMNCSFSCLSISW